MKRVATNAMFVFAGLFLALASFSAAKKTPSVPFDHKRHIREVELACADCHTEASSATSAAADLIPRLENCFTCHDQTETSWQGPADGSSPWPATPRELVFDHARHASLGIECASCHAGIASATRAPSGHLPAMSACTDCHESRELSDDCNLCHSQVRFLRPRDHIADWVLDHRTVARSDAKSCETCHRASYCSECHEGAALGFAVRGKTDAPADRIGPMASAHESSRITILQRAHALNYRYTHGADVRAKTLDCAACHETQSFCNACHNPENDASRFRPVWHDMLDFEQRGHAGYARRDIEACAACHDQSGADPSCMRCHKSIVSPHPAGFMQDVNGPWHNDNNAVCFACHELGSRTPGVGFCGKCHG